jgi:hypothetical protein
MACDITSVQRQSSGSAWRSLWEPAQYRRSREGTDPQDYKNRGNAVHQQQSRQAEKQHDAERDQDDLQ